MDASRVVQANAMYHNRLAEEYETEFEQCYKEAGPRIETVARWLSAVTGGQFWLDLGCGTGTVLEIALHFFESGAGIDISEGMLREARRRGLTVRVGEVESVPCSDGCADVVSAFSVLHHLYDPIKGLQEMIRLVKPGGYIYTDWDPNCRALYRSWVLKGVWGWRRLLRAKAGLRPRLRDRRAELRRLHRWAEFHHDLGGGLDGEALARRLRAADLHVEVFYYDGNPSSLMGGQYEWGRSGAVKKAIQRMLLGWRWPSLKRSELCHRFAILARKRGA